MSLALVCGRGDLPARIAAGQDQPPMVCALEGFEPQGLVPDIVFRLETLGSLLVRLGHEGITEVCFCGAIERPGINPGLIDEQTRPLVPILAEAMTAGDDAALRAVIGVFEQTGFRIRSSQELSPDVLIAEGVLSDAQPTEAMHKDANLGRQILGALSPLDVAQACVVGQGALLGVETIAGTDALLAGLPEVPQRAAGVLVKGPKSGQDRRVDMPTIGPETARRAAAAGLSGIVLDAGGVILMDPEETVALCNAAGLVLWARGADG